MPDAAYAAQARSAGAPARQFDDRLFLACGLSWGAALIHLHAASDHVEYVPFAVLFALLATAQLAWGVAVYRSRGRELLGAGAVLSLLVVAVWAVSRTVGLPIGPEPWSPEPVAAIDVIASADEVVLALLVLLHVRATRAGTALRGLRNVVALGGLGLVLLSSLVVTVPHSH